MTTTYTGKVFWANGIPNPNVEVRLFRPRKGQNLGKELTIQPGISSPDGTFTIQIHDSLFLDKALLEELKLLSPQFERIDPQGFNLRDDTRPLLQFAYLLKGRQTQTLMPFHKLHRGYYLPYNIPVDFKPSKDGFAFANSFKPFDPPITLPDWLGVRRILEPYGLCGGMSSAAYDFCLARVDTPKAPDIRKYTSVPKTGTRLHRYLISRSLDTFGTSGGMISKVGDWTLRPDQGLVGTQKLTLDEFPIICQSLDNGQLVVITLIYEHAGDLKELAKKIWLNHQVLAFDYLQTSQDDVTIHIYDSNYPNRDDIDLHIQRVQIGDNGNEAIFGLVSREVVPGKSDLNVRGFFPMPYQSTSPP